MPADDMLAYYCRGLDLEMLCGDPMESIRRYKTAVKDIAAA